MASPPVAGAVNVNVAASARIRIYLVAVLLSSLLVKGYFAAITVGAPLIWDERDYYQLGELIADHGFDPRVYPGAYRSPGYPFFLAIPLWLFGSNVAAVKLTQVALSVASAAILYSLVRSLYGPRAGLMAAAMVSFLPELVGLSFLLWPETIFIFLAISGLWLTLSAHQRGSPWISAVSGVVWGIAVMVKTGYVFYPPLAAVIFAIPAVRERKDRRRCLSTAGLFFAGFLCVLSPWLLRNSLRYHRVFYLTSNTWVNLWSGNRSLSTPFVARYFAIEDEAEREALARHEALQWIRQQGWRWPFLKLHHNIPFLFGASNFTMRHIYLGVYGDVALGSVRVIVVASIVSYVVVMALGIAGFAVAPWDPLKLHVLALFVPTVALHVLMESLTRYREPLVPLVIIYAARGLMLGWRGLASACRRPLAGALLAVLVYALAFSMDNRGTSALWSGRTFHPAPGSDPATRGDPEPAR